MVGHKTSLNKLKKTEIIPTIFTNNGIILDINYKKKLENYKYVEIKQHAPEQPIDQERN